jgi:hypothetical protein
MHLDEGQDDEQQEEDEMTREREQQSDREPRSIPPFPTMKSGHQARTHPAMNNAIPMKFRCQFLHPLVVLGHCAPPQGASTLLDPQKSRDFPDLSLCGSWRHPDA